MLPDPDLTRVESAWAAVGPAFENSDNLLPVDDDLFEVLSKALELDVATAFEASRDSRGWARVEDDCRRLRECLRDRKARECSYFNALVDLSDEVSVLVSSLGAPAIRPGGKPPADAEDIEREAADLGEELERVAGELDDSDPPQAQARILVQNCGRSVINIQVGQFNVFPEDPFGPFVGALRLLVDSRLRRALVERLKAAWRRMKRLAKRIGEWLAAKGQAWTGATEADLWGQRAEPYLERIEEGALDDRSGVFRGGDPVGLSDLGDLRDADFAPEMVVIPARRFWMGSLESEEGRNDDEGPRHEVMIGASFALGRFPVTFDEYARFCGATGQRVPDGSGWGKGRRPMINVNWKCAHDYATWLSAETGKDYRLPSEAEWEYAARAGSATGYWWGDVWDASKANGRDGGPGRTTEVGDYPANPWGLFDMLGNVWEWVADHWHGGYAGAPADGRAWRDEERGDVERSTSCVVRGGSWNHDPGSLRCANRDWLDIYYLDNNVGFRVARTL